jgi:thymidylate synthase (FAD)
MDFVSAIISRKTQSVLVPTIESISCVIVNYILKMKTVNSSYEIIKPDGKNIAGMLRFITRCAYTCYKTNKEITDDVAATFVDGLIKSGHTAMLEHGTVYLSIPVNRISQDVSNKMKLLISCHLWTRYTEKVIDDMPHVVIVTNFRVIVENNLQDFMKRFWYIPTDDELLCRPTIKFICDRGVSHEIVRHRVFSFAMESTRYCNYSKDKFGNSVTFVSPDWMNMADDDEFKKDLETLESIYFKWLDRKKAPELARYFLPTGVKTELIVTGFNDDWDHFFDLRALNKTGRAHPDIKKLAEPLYKEFIKAGIIEEKKDNKNLTLN